MFLIWRRFVRWLRNLGIKLGRKQPVDWTAEISDLLGIVNSALDKEGVPKVPNPTPNNPTPASEPTSQPIPNSTAAPSKPTTPPAPMTDQSAAPVKQRRFQGRLIAWLRRRNSERKANEANLTDSTSTSQNK